VVFCWGIERGAKHPHGEIRGVDGSLTGAGGVVVFGSSASLCACLSACLSVCLSVSCTYHPVSYCTVSYRADLVRASGNRHSVGFYIGSEIFPFFPFFLSPSLSLSFSVSVSFLPDTSVLSLPPPRG
jgi:hypothetical protein